MNTLHIIATAGIVLLSCNSASSDKGLKDPAATHPPSEAIPDSMKIVADSAIVPDSNSGIKDTMRGN